MEEARRPCATLAEMFDLKGVDLSLVATDTTDVEMLVLNHRTAPGVPVEWAVRMSMSIPFVWREVVWRGEWGQYRNRGKMNAEGGRGNVIVDGGVLSNFPIRLVADDPADDEFVAEVMGAETDAAAAGNLGLLIDENLAVAQTHLALLDAHAISERDAEKDENSRPTFDRRRPQILKQQKV